MNIFLRYSVLMTFLVFSVTQSVLLFANCIPTNQTDEPEPDAPRIKADYRHAVFQIRNAKNPNLASGTATIIDKRGYFITAAHNFDYSRFKVVSNKPIENLRLVNSLREFSIEEVYFAGDEKKEGPDLAVVKAKQVIGEPIQEKIPNIIYGYEPFDDESTRISNIVHLGYLFEDTDEDPQLLSTVLKKYVVVEIDKNAILKQRPVDADIRNNEGKVLVMRGIEPSGMGNGKSGGLAFNRDGNGIGVYRLPIVGAIREDTGNKVAYIFTPFRSPSAWELINKIPPDQTVLKLRAELVSQKKFTTSAKELTAIQVNALLKSEGISAMMNNKTIKSFLLKAAECQNAIDGLAEAFTFATNSKTIKQIDAITNLELGNEFFNESNSYLKTVASSRLRVAMLDWSLAHYEAFRSKSDEVVFADEETRKKTVAQGLTNYANVSLERYKASSPTEKSKYLDSSLNLATEAIKIDPQNKRSQETKVAILKESKDFDRRFVKNLGPKQWGWEPTLNPLNAQLYPENQFDLPSLLHKYTLDGKTNIMTWGGTKSFPDGDLFPWSTEFGLMDKKKEYFFQNDQLRKQLNNDTKLKSVN